MKESGDDILAALNFSDYFTLAMDQEIRNEGLAGSHCGFALELNQLPDIDVLQQRIVEFGQRFPVALASLQQRGKHFYWCQRSHPESLFFQHQCPENQSCEEFHSAKVNEIINQVEPRDTVSPITFHLICSATKTTFFTHWIHPFCDARGVELILKFLSTDDQEQRQKIGQPETKALVNIQLEKYRWWQKVVLLFKGKRYIQSIDKLSSIQPLNIHNSPQQLNHTIKKLSISQTEQVIKLAKKQVGLTGTSLYYIGCFMRALDKINPNSAGEAYCVPYAFNLRKQRVLTPVTGNHVCALFAQAARTIVKDRDVLFAHLKQQNRDVIRNKLDYAFLPLMWAGSWLSLEKYGKILRLSNSNKERSSFWFSDIGKLDMSDQAFLGAEILSVFHACQVTSPPGIAFLCCIYQDQLTISYNFIEPLANKEIIEQLHAAVVIELLEN